MPETASSLLAGKLIRERRQALGLRQADLAGQAGISASYLNLIEHNRRKARAEVLERLALVLGVEPAVLAEGAGVVTCRADVRYVTTEFGTASLFGKSIRERAKALIEIAHPDFREQLCQEARKRCLV